MTCICGHDEHAWDEPTVCKTLSCNCEKYVEATPEKPVDQPWNKYTQELATIQQKVAAVLEEVPELRNYANKEFYKWFCDNIHDVNPETVTRTRRKLVEENPVKYGPTDSKVIQEKNLKEFATKEWALAR